MKIIELKPRAQLRTKNEKMQGISFHHAQNPKIQCTVYGTDPPNITRGVIKMAYSSSGLEAHVRHSNAIPVSSKSSVSYFPHLSVLAFSAPPPSKNKNIQQQRRTLSPFTLCGFRRNTRKKCRMVLIHDVSLSTSQLE
jgi:hypothetical protein